MNGADIVSRVAEGNIPAGSVVSRGTGNSQVVKGGTTPFAIALRSADTEFANGLADKEVIGALRTGYVNLDVKNTGAKGAALYSVDATGEVYVGTASTGQTQIPVTLEETLTAAGVAICRARF
jgi:hypothetical protein